MLYAFDCRIKFIFRDTERRKDSYDLNNTNTRKVGFPIQSDKENIRRYILRGSLYKKVHRNKNKERDSDLGEAYISSDENSDCCSEPTNRSEDISYDQDLNEISNTKKVRRVEVQNNSDTHIDIKSDNNTADSKLRNLGRSLQNVREVKSEVILNQFLFSIGVMLQKILFVNELFKFTC